MNLCYMYDLNTGLMRFYCLYDKYTKAFPKVPMRVLQIMAEVPILSLLYKEVKPEQVQDKAIEIIRNDFSFVTDMSGVLGRVTVYDKIPYEKSETGVYWENGHIYNLALVRYDTDFYRRWTAFLQYIKPNPLTMRKIEAETFDTFVVTLKSGVKVKWHVELKEIKQVVGSVNISDQGKNREIFIPSFYYPADLLLDETPYAAPIAKARALASEPLNPLGLLRHKCENICVMSHI